MEAKDKKFYPPVVAVLGHVDHGKTSLLDVIRKTSIAARETGGITQKIGASSIEIEHENVRRRITFIDTPGHEAFSNMRTRGAQAADIGLLVVSVVDGVMPQTIESISLLKQSKIPFIAVLTKSDSPQKNTQKAIQGLVKEGVSLEGYGGDVPFIEVSAKENNNIKELLDLILLVFDVSPQHHALSEKFQGVVIESRLDERSGPLATVVVKKGTLNVREDIESLGVEGRVKAMISPSGKQEKTAGVGDAVEILGFEKVPSVGSLVFKKGEVEETEEKQKESQRRVSDEAALSLIIAADTEGSLEAIIASIPERINLIGLKTGDITTADVIHAKSTDSFVLGFNVKIKPDAQKLAETEKVLTKTYKIIYEMLSEIKDALEGKELSQQEQIFGTAKVLASFPYEKTKVLGISVEDGRVAKGDRVRIVRGEQIIGESHISSLRQGKEQTSKVEKGEEAGILITPLLDFEIGDMLICHG